LPVPYSPPVGEPKNPWEGNDESGLELDWGERRSRVSAPEDPPVGAPDTAAALPAGAEPSSRLAIRFSGLSSDPAMRPPPVAPGRSTGAGGPRIDSAAGAAPPARHRPVLDASTLEATATPAWVTAAATPARWTAIEEDAALEQRLRRWCIPAALAGSFLLVQTGMGRFLATLFSGMWLHELGHAITAWLCGRFAFPGPWRTAIGEARSWPVILCVAGAIAYLAYRQRLAEHPRWFLLPSLLLALQLIGTLLLRPSQAQAAITFGGEAGAMLLGALLMVTFYASSQSQLRKGWLRWGFLVLGALAFTETADTWWDAVTDVDRIPFGEIEGVGLSDPTKLTDLHGWSERGLIRAHVSVSALALLGVAAFYVRGLRVQEEQAP